MKNVLKVIVSGYIFLWNEMLIVFVEVECLINSRFLGYFFNDFNDF